jgi:hypothetical protein
MTPESDISSIMDMISDMVENKDEILANARSKRELEQDRMVFKRPPMAVSWATCRQCARQAVPLEEGLCDLCGPVNAATLAAISVSRAKY